ncbi:unnamed protein product [Thelazia callipaeda]|uniref:Myb-like domain-containing protein n=1 Tax=Thelazia callipaeda TaxID=103827 RepID=A0A0N5D975_THECL|nr:unnamed protein product [Thelazia callipaeda]
MRAKPAYLPDKGYLNENGIPIYHISRTVLTPEQLQRIKDCGVKFRAGKFSKEENDQIKRNWKKYAEANNIELSQAYKFAGGSRYLMDRDKWKDMLQFQAKTNFIPLMCKGLNDRLGRQVIARMFHLFHPYAKQRPKWNNELQKKFEELYAEGLPSEVISLRLKRPKTVVDHHISLLRLRKGNLNNDDVQEIEFDDSTRQVIYDFIKKRLTRRHIPLGLENMFPPETTNYNVADFAMLEDQEKAMSFIPWVVLTRSMLRPVPVIRKIWSMEVEKLRDACKRFDGDTLKATNACFPQVPSISVGEYKRSLKLILEQNPVYPKNIDTDLLQKRIMEQNLVGYCTNGLLESEYLKRISYRQLKNFLSKNQIFLSFPLCDWIKILLKYLDTLDENSRQWVCKWKPIKDIYLEFMRKTGKNIDGADDNEEKAGKYDLVTLDSSNQIKESCVNGSKENNGVEKHLLKEEITFYRNQHENVIEKLKRLVESRLALFDDSRQQKFARKLERAMKKDEKIVALRKLIEKMISKLEDEDERKLSKKYRKIIKKYLMVSEKTTCADFNEKDTVVENGGSIGNNGMEEFSECQASYGKELPVEVCCENEKEVDENVVVKVSRKNRKRKASEMNVHDEKRRRNSLAYQCN